MEYSHNINVDPAIEMKCYFKFSVEVVDNCQIKMKHPEEMDTFEQNQLYLLVCEGRLKLIFQEQAHLHQNPKAINGGIKQLAECSIIKTVSQGHPVTQGPYLALAVLYAV